MTDELNNEAVEEVLEEQVVEETQPAVPEESKAEAPAENPAIHPSLDLETFAPPPAKQSDEDLLASIIDEMVEKKLSTRHAQEYDETELEETLDEDNGIATKKDLERIKQEARQEALESVRQQQEAAVVVQRSMQESGEVRKSVVEKVTKILASDYDIDFETNKQYRTSADLLWRQMESQLSQQLQRQPIQTPKGPQHVFTKQETEFLAQSWWKAFCDMALPAPKSKGAVEAENPNLSAAGGSVGTGVHAGAPREGLENYVAKQRSGERVSALEGLKLFNTRTD